MKRRSENRMTTYKTLEELHKQNAECPLARKLIDDVYFCKYTGKCVDKIELGMQDGNKKLHYFCGARLEGLKRLEEN